MVLTKSLRSQIEFANSKEADVAISGRIELPKDESKIILRFNADAYVEFPSEGLVPESITAFLCKERREIAREANKRVLGLDDWVHLKIRYGTICKLHYKIVSVEFALNQTQQPFYIDTDTLKVVYLDRHVPNPSIKQISCDELSDDRTNKEVIVYTNRACCCNNNHVEAYGKVSCDDGWRSSDCL